MHNAKFADGSPQSLYFESGLSTGLFKGMTVILQEQGLHDKAKLKAECKKFICPTGNKSCCQCWVLYHQADFEEVKYVLETLCQACGYPVLFSPNFNCKLSFIEQYWVFSKHIYQKYPASYREADLETNVLSALNSILLESVHRYL